MAGTVKATITANFQDSEGHKYRIIFYSDQDVTATNLTGLRAAVFDDPLNPVDASLQAKLQRCSNATLTHMEIGIVGPKTNYTKPTENVDGEIKGRFAFRAADDSVFSFSIPGFKHDEFVEPQGDKIILDWNIINSWSTTDPLAFTPGENPPLDLVSYLLDDQWFGNGSFTNRYGQDLTELVSAKEKWGKKRKPLR